MRLERKVRDLEEELENLSDVLRRQIAAVKKDAEERENSFGASLEQHLDLVTTACAEMIEEKMALLSQDTLRPDIDSKIATLEARMTEATKESIRAMKEELEGSVREKSTELEKKIALPSRTVSLLLNDIHLYIPSDSPPVPSWVLESGIHRPSRKRMQGPYKWNGLQQPRLEITYAFVPADTPSTCEIGTDLLRKETVTSPTFTRVIPAGQKIIVSKAEIWHCTMGLPNMFDCTSHLTRACNI
jgi:hypothetical protein